MHHVDVGFDTWHATVTAAKSTKGGFPLVRRLADYYRDTSFDADELCALRTELECLRASTSADVAPLIALIRAALAVERGISVIAD